MPLSFLLTICSTLLVSIELTTAAGLIPQPACDRVHTYRTKPECQRSCPAPQLCEYFVDQVTPHKPSCWRCPNCFDAYRYFTKQTCDANCKRNCQKMHYRKCWYCDDLRVDCFRRPQSMPTERRCNQVYSIHPIRCQRDSDGCWAVPPCHQNAIFYLSQVCSKYCGSSCVKGPKRPGGIPGYCWRCKEKTCPGGFQMERDCRAKCDRPDRCYLKDDGCWSCPNCLKKHQWYTKKDCKSSCTKKCHVTQKSSRRCWSCSSQKPKPCQDPKAYEFVDKCRGHCTKGPNLCYRDKKDCWRCPNCVASAHQYYTLPDCNKTRCMDCEKGKIHGDGNEKCWLCMSRITTTTTGTTTENTGTTAEYTGTTTEYTGTTTKHTGTTTEYTGTTTEYTGTTTKYTSTTTKFTGSTTKFTGPNPPPPIRTTTTPKLKTSTTTPGKGAMGLAEPQKQRVLYWTVHIVGVVFLIGNLIYM